MYDPYYQQEAAAAAGGGREGGFFGERLFTGARLKLLRCLQVSSAELETIVWVLGGIRSRLARFTG
jgi:hypothetical protein